MFAPGITPTALRSHGPGGCTRGRAILAALRRPVTGFVFLLCVSASARCEEAVLLTATAPGFVPGMVIATTQRLVVPEAASVTLLFRSGQMLQLKGPFDGPLEQAQSSQGGKPPSVLAQMLRLRGVDAGVIGGTRGTNAVSPQAAHRDVVVDPRRSATYCVQPADTVWIGVQVRPGRSGGGTYHLRRHGSERSIAWSPDASRIPWPDDIPIEDGDRFEIANEGVVAAIAFRMLRDSYASEAARIAAGLLGGCEAQFDGMLDRLIQDSVAPELWLNSERGRTPRYHRDEAIGLTAQSNVDGYLYCMMEGEDGAAKLMPVSGIHVRAALPVALTPRHGLQIRSPGPKQVSCWLSRHDLSDKVPATFLVPSGERTSRQETTSLHLLFEQIDGAQVARATLEVLVN